MSRTTQHVSYQYNVSLVIKATAKICLTTLFTGLSWKRSVLQSVHWPGLSNLKDC